ncbi:hypothetical protein Tco_1017564 [Tanacetum coccineum]|uniref:Uncharacterized protein n=1 Tax=Tanacetum coccineum TaxID=301880 RepID=A0ABQ5FSA0_9ASTR
MCLADNVIEISSGKIEGSRDWNSLEYQDTAGSKENKVMNALNFYRMETDEISERYIAPCFVNGLEAFDGEVNLAFDENLISNEFAVKLCLDYEMKKGKKLVKKELIVALKGELYFVKFIINPKEDDFEPRVILGRSFMRLAKGIVDFSNGFGEELPPFVCKMGKSNRNKKRAIENLNLFYQDIGLSSSTRGHLAQEEAAKEALVIRISQKFALLEEERPVIEKMAYHGKYKKILDEIWKDKVELDGKTMKEVEEAVKRIKGEALKEKDDPATFIFLIRLEGKVNKNALADTRSDINIMPYQIYEMLGREEMKKIDRGITMINHTQAEAMGKLSNVLCQVGILNTLEILFSTFDGVCHQTFRAARFDVLRTAESDSDDEKDYEHTTKKPDHQDPNARDNTKPWKRLAQLLPRHIYSPCVMNWDVLNQMGCDGEIDDMLRIRLREAGSDEEIFTLVAWIRAFNINEPIYAELCHEFYSTYEFDEVCADDELQSKKIIKFRLGGRAHNLTLLEFSRRLGLYQAVELEEEGFNVYFEGGLRNDDYFNAQDY